MNTLTRPSAASRPQSFPPLPETRKPARIHYRKRGGKLKVNAPNVLMPEGWLARWMAGRFAGGWCPSCNEVSHPTGGWSLFNSHLRTPHSASPQVARASGALRARKLKKTEVGATEASARLPGHPGNLRNGPGGAPGILGRSPGAVEAKKGS